MLTYMATLAALTLTPGPLVAVMAARAASADRSGACALAVGICLGDILVIVAICAGLGIWLEARPEVFDFFKYAGIGFLLLIALRMWRSTQVSTDHPAGVTGIIASGLAGLSICLSSPQTLVIYLVLLPQVTDITRIGMAELIPLVLATSVALFGVFLVVILMAEIIQRALRSAAGVAVWSRVMSSSVALSAVWIGLQ
ncbi:LysE family translocator [Thetidibacter halocola]|nr:LysE family transporter [Thetidibacter halocola]